MNHKIFLLSAVIALAACQSNETTHKKPINNSKSEWILSPQQSTLSFITTKNKVLTEEHIIKFKSGFLNNNNFHAAIELNTVDTLIPIRDQRLKEVLFQVEKYPTAEVSSFVPSPVRSAQPKKLEFTLNLHGHQRQYEALVLVQMVADNLVVINYDPISVSAKDFGLDAAVQKLTKIANLQSINYDVLVNFKLVFEK